MLELNKIRKSYDGVTILDNISLSIESGEIHAGTIRLRQDNTS